MDSSKIELKSVDETVWQSMSVYSAAAIGVIHIFALAVSALNRNSGNFDSIARNDIVEGINYSLIN